MKLQTKLHIMVLALHRVDILLIECSTMCVCWPKSSKYVAIVHCGMMYWFHLYELV